MPAGTARCARARSASSAAPRFSIATREAVPGDDLETLHREVLARFAADLDAERTERVESTQLHLAAIREIMRQLQAGAEAP